MSCTTILVGKKASYDGSTIIARDDDSGSGRYDPKKFIAVAPQDQPRHYRSVLSHVEIDLPDNPCRYSIVPNVLPNRGILAEAGVNEHNVAMSATETIAVNERVLAADPLVELQPANEAADTPEIPGGIGEEDIITLVLPYVTTAREGVARLAELLETYGTYESNGIIISDVNEIWYVETIGGHHWIARRVPDDCYVTMPNQLGIDSFDLDDAYGEKHCHLCSPDLREWVAANHLDLSLDGQLNPRDAFGSHSDSDHVYNTPRAWAIQRFLSPTAGPWDRALPAEDFGPECDRLAWCRRPERKVTIEDVKYALSLCYQGTPYDPYGHDPAGRPGRYRPIGINRNSQLAVLQLRPYEPEATRALQWVSLGSNAYNALVPFYANVGRTPAYLEDTTTRVTSENFYWANRIIGALADGARTGCVPHVERYQEVLPAATFALVRACDERVRKDAVAGDDVCGELEAANDAIADECRRQTEVLLDHVLYEASMGMGNAFCRSDG